MSCENWELYHCCCKDQSNLPRNRSFPAAVSHSGLWEHLWNGLYLIFVFSHFMGSAVQQFIRTSPGHLHSSDARSRRTNSGDRGSGSQWLLSGSRAALPAPSCRASAPGCLLLGPISSLSRAEYYAHSPHSLSMQTRVDGLTTGRHAVARRESVVLPQAWKQEGVCTCGMQIDDGGKTIKGRQWLDDSQRNPCL